MAKPGVMLYFTMGEPLKFLSYEEKGRMLDAILEYGQYGVCPEFEGMLGMAWAFIRPQLDQDNERYERQVRQKSYASFVRELKKRNLPNITFEEWLEMDENERHRLMSGDIG